MPAGNVIEEFAAVVYNFKCGSLVEVTGHAKLFAEDKLPFNPRRMAVTVSGDLL